MSIHPYHPFIRDDLEEHIRQLEKLGYDKREPVFWELCHRFAGTFTADSKAEHYYWYRWLEVRKEKYGEA